MLIAHLPAGYILFKAVDKKNTFQEKDKKPLLFGILLGSILPDVDTIWFYLVSDRSAVHHSYWTHTPFFWTMVFVLIYTFSRILKLRRISVFTLGCWVSIILHLILDSIAGQIRWTWPFSNQAVQLVEIPATHDWWVLSFIFHWTFLLEIGFIAVAIFIFLKERARLNAIK